MFIFKTFQTKGLNVQKILNFKQPERYEPLCSYFYPLVLYKYLYKLNLRTEYKNEFW